MLSEKPLLRSEKVLFIVAGPIALVMALAAPVVAVF
jgi:hypothetical protein